MLSSFLVIGTDYDLDGDIRFFLIVSIAAQMVLQVLTIFLNRKYFQIRGSYEWSKLRTLVWESLPLTLMSLFVCFISRADIMFLERFRGSQDVGLYSAAGRIVQIFTYLPQAIAASLLPVLPVIRQTNDSNAVLAVRESRRTLLAFGIFLPVLTFFRGEDIIRLLFGESYIQAGLVFVLLSFTLPAICVGILPSNLLTAQGKQWQNLKFVLAAAVLSVSFNFLFIQKFGMIGAAITSNLTYLLLVTLQIRAGLSLSQEIFRFWEDLLVVLPALCAVILLFFLTRSLPSIPVILCSGLLYLALLRIRGLPISLKGPAPSTPDV